MDWLSWTGIILSSWPWPRLSSANYDTCHSFHSSHEPVTIDYPMVTGSKLLVAVTTLEANQGQNFPVIVTVPLEKI